MKKMVVLFLIICLFILNIKAINAKQIVDVGGISSNEDVVVSKTVEKTDIENYFDITLKVTTPYNIEQIKKTDDLDVIIVMDISNTMVTTNIDGTSSENNSNKDTRYQAAMNAASNFINGFFEYDNSSKRKIGYVVFNSDATKIFDLQEIENKAKVNELVNIMKNKTSKIVNDENYSISNKRFTNIEAGLKMAGDMLEESKSKNKYILLLSDGFPTTYIKDGYIGYDTYTKDAKQSSIGNFYNSNKNLPCSYGTSYSDRAAENAQNQAQKLKNKGITIFTVGAGLDGQTSITELMNHDTKLFSVVDSYKTSENKNKYGYDYVIGNSVNDFKNWLKNNIGSGFYYDTNDTKKLIEAYENIFSNIEKINQSKIENSWIVSDVINDEDIKYIEFLGFYDNNNLVSNMTGTYGENNSNTAFISDDKITWDLKSSGYSIGNNGKNYNYQIKYKIRLRNELPTFIEDKPYNTNGDTHLTYRTNTDGILSEEKTINFKIPKVKGFLSNLSIIKMSSLGLTPLSGVKFKLTHDIEEYEEHSNVEIKDEYAISDEEGLLKFSNIPSGHKYILVEDETLKNYIKDDANYDINVSYGNIFTKSDVDKDKNNNLIIKNDMKTGSIEINKIVKNGSKTDNFDFIIRLDNELIDGQYGDLNFIGGISKFKLKDGDNVIISNIPIDTKYEINEINSEYEVISTNATGEVKEDETIKVTFINNLKESEIIPPNTFDNILYIILSSIISIVSLILIFVYYKKKSA